MSILKTYKIAASTALLFMGGVAFAQNDPASNFSSYDGVTKDWKPSLVRDGVYDRVQHINTPLRPQEVRENDLMYKKRIWREIDIREKQNMAFRYPGDDYTGGGQFIEIILDAVSKGKIKAYSNMDDRFTTALTKEQIIDMLVGQPDTTWVTDPETQQEKMVIKRREFNPDVVTKYRLKEEWYIDRNIGRMQRQIIGIAPFKDIYNDDGSFRASQAVFWLYYPEITSMLAQYEVFNPDNDVARMSWYEFFEGRYFASRIIKVSNPFDYSFKEKGMGNLEALYEGQKATEMLFNKEHDMWVY
ncbi:MAG TPA: gliding motility protein GldN [Flavipsychrobacter sp.]|jgi:gliding motility associated protien GldN|nr:gliding motility protein GldN [Flavipsychrobacter sp.]